MKPPRAPRSSSETVRSLAATATKCPAEGCSGYIEPTTNGAGQVIDRPCPECARRNAPPRRKLIQRCLVEGCPGTVHVLIEGDSRRELRPCWFCTKRRDWTARVLRHGTLPTPECIICTAPIAPREGPGRQDIYCPVCKPMREQVRAQLEARR